MGNDGAGRFASGNGCTKSQEKSFGKAMVDLLLQLLLVYNLLAVDGSSGGTNASRNTSHTLSQ